MSNPAEELPARRIALLLSLIVVGSILTQGYAEGIINHGIQLPLIRMYAGDDAFARDAMMQTLARTYTTAFYPAYGALARVLPLAWLLRGSFLVYRAASVWLAYRLGRAVFGDAKTGLLSALITSMHWLTFADDIVSDTYLTHGALAQVLTLGALVLHAQGRTALAMALAGALFHVHGMHATHLLVVLGVATLAGRDARARLGPLALGSAAALALLAPNLWWMRAEGVLGAPVPDGYVEVVRAWFPTHFWPSSWGLTDWLAFLFPTLAAWPCARLAGPAADGGRTARAAVYAFAFAALGALVVELSPSAFALRLHPMRASWIMALAGAPFLARAILGLLARSRDEARRAPARASDFTTALALGCVLAFPMAYRATYGVTLLPALWAAALGAEGAWSAGALAALAVALPWLQSSWSAHALDGLGELAALAGRMVRAQGALALVPLGLVILARGRPGRQRFDVGARRRAAVLVGAVAALDLIGSGLFLARQQQRGAPHAWREVQAWAQANLAKGERVLVPLGQIGLRAFSDQVPALDFQDGDLLLHSPGWMHDFVARLELYGWKPRAVQGFGYVAELEALDRAMSADDLQRIGRALDARVAIRRARWPALALPRLYANDRFVVYRLDR